MFCHRSRQETQKYHFPQSTMLWVQRRLHLPLVSIHYRGRRHWTICWQGKADFFKSVGRTWPRQWQSTGTFKARAEHLSEAPINVIEALVCQLYLPHTELTNGANASWWLFKKKQAQWAPLPSFTSSSYNASPVYEAMTWYNEGIPNPGLPQPVDYV